MDTDAFKPLIHEIAKIHQIDVADITPQGFSTNAVFKVGHTIFKIFAPPSSGANTISDFNAELLALTRAYHSGVKVPKLFHKGLIECKYPFYYMIFEYIEALEARDVVKKYSIEEKKIFVDKITTILEALNVTPNESSYDVTVKERYKIFNKWKTFQIGVQQQVDTHIQALKLENLVYVHGDITEDNILISEDNEVYLIDFADSTIAPAYYEYPSIVFGLFDFDQTLFNLFIKDTPIDSFIDMLFDSILLHEFGAIFVEMILNKVGSLTKETLDDIYKIKPLLHQLFNKSVQH
jgi:thiamine kinase-like enzyme